MKERLVNLAAGAGDVSIVVTLDAFVAEDVAALFDKLHAGRFGVHDLDGRAFAAFQFKQRVSRHQLPGVENQVMNFAVGGNGEGQRRDFRLGFNFQAERRHGLGVLDHAGLD